MSEDAMNYDEMKAGPEMNLLVATEVLGLHTGQRHHDMGVWASPDGKIWRRLADYSNDNAAAHEALEKMREKGWKVEIILWPGEDEVDEVVLDDGKRTFRSRGAFALAACRAMLKASA